MSEIFEEKPGLDLSDMQRAHDEFYKNNFFDVQIHCKSIILPAHRYVLSSRSDLLAEKLASGVDRLDWDEFEDRTSIALLRWIYTNKIVFSHNADVTTEEQWIDLLYGSHKLELVSLCAICERKLVSQVSDTSTRRFYDIAKKVRAYQLWEKCLKLGLNKFDSSTYEIRDDHLSSSCCSESLSISDEINKEEELLQFNKLTMGCHEFRQFSDIEVATGGVRWKAHAHVLKSRSKKLLKECRQRGLPYDYGFKLLRWIYTDSLVIDTPRRYNINDFRASPLRYDTTNLILTARRYDLPTLFEGCERDIIDNIEIESCAYLHRFAEKHDVPTLLKCCKQLISRYYIKSKFSDCSQVTAETEMEFENSNSTSEMLVCELPPEELADEATEGLLMLNDDCLLHLFRFVSLVDLASIKGTCKRLSALADQYFKLYGDKYLEIIGDTMFGNIWILKNFGKFIESLSFDDFYARYASQDNMFELIARHTGDQLKEITLWCCGRTENKSFEALRTVLKNVHCIHLIELDYDSNYDTLLNYCESLRVVRLQGGRLKPKSEWYLNNPNITEIFLCAPLDTDDSKEICRNCAQLERLSLCNFGPGTGTDELINLSQLSSTLKELEIDAGHFLIVDELQRFADKTVLNDLTLQYSNITESLLNLLGDFPNLSNLSFAYGSNFDGNIWDSFSKNLTNIKSLSFSGIHNLTFEVVANAVKNLLDLKKLRLSGCDQITFISRNEYRSLRKIRSLEIWLNEDVYKRTCELIADNWLDNIQVKTIIYPPTKYL